MTAVCHQTGIHHSRDFINNDSCVSTFVDGIKRSLAEHPETLPWRRVTVPGLAVAWVGLNVPALDTGGRPWVWEVVTPHQYQTSPRMQSDPMVLPVAHDTVIAEISHDQSAHAVLRMQVPVRYAPDTVAISHSPASDGSWSVHLESGWTVQALATAAQAWIDRESPGTARLDILEPPLQAHQRYKLHPAIDIESAAFDHLLTLNPDDAATVTSLLARVHDALLEYR